MRLRVDIFTLTCDSLIYILFIPSPFVKTRKYGGIQNTRINFGFFAEVLYYVQYKLIEITI